HLRAGAPSPYGRAATLSILGDAAPERSTYQWRPLGGGVSRDGRGGYSFGIATTAMPNAEGPPAVRVDRYLAFWRRGQDQPWRIIAYADVGGPPPGSAAQIPAAEFPPVLAIPRGRRADAVRQARQAARAFALPPALTGTR